MALCKRHSRDAAPEAAQALWFGVLQCYVALLRELRQRERGLQVPDLLCLQPWQVCAGAGSAERDLLLCFPAKFWKRACPSVPCCSHAPHQCRMLP